MADFDSLEPKKPITDPKNQGVLLAELPRHLYKFASEEGDDTIIVAWKGKKAIHNSRTIVNTQKEKAAALKYGYGLQPVLDDPDAAKTE